jgi:hypothetical protein
MSTPIIYTDDVQLLKNYPSFEYNPAATEPDGVYHEDREIGGIMYRAANATYNDLLGYWAQSDGSQPSYATTQNTDGSISYLYMPPVGTAHWTTWQSADLQEYYAVNYGLDPLDTGSGNTSVLITAISDIIAAGGGILRLPAGTFQLDGAITADFTGANAGLIIAGFSARTRLIQNSNDSHIFDISHSGASSTIVIKDLTLQYASMAPAAVIAAVNLTDCQNVICERVYFQDCPTSFQTQSDCLQCGLFECTIQYDLKTGGEVPLPVTDQIMVYLRGSGDFVTGCGIGQRPINKMPAGPTGCTGIALLGNTNGRFITDTHLVDFSIGIALTGPNMGGLIGVYCSDVLINAYTTAVTIAATSDMGTINDIHFTGCTLAASHYASGGTSGVTITTGGFPSITVSGIYFSNCSVYGFEAAGIEIDSGQNIVISGGQYSSNGQSPPEDAAYLAAGIEVLGGEDITISGVDCSGVNGAWSSMVSGATEQPYGIAVGEDASDVLIVGCNLTGNLTNGLYLFELDAVTPFNVYVRDCDVTGYSTWNVAINIASTATLVQVTNCAGYNGALTTAVTTSPPVSGHVFHASDYGYYGPTTFYVAVNTIVTAVKINGVTTGVKTGAFFLTAGQSGEIDYGLVAPGFVMIGQ